MKLLILGGTGEARELANALVSADHDVTTSLAGVTENPVLPAGEIHTGGFGGPEGLSAFLAAEKFDYLIDATHPFAGQISASAVAASELASIPLLRLTRPQWAPGAGETWQHAADIESAAKMLPEGAHAFVTTGRKEIEPFLARTDCRILLRMIEPPEGELPLHAMLVIARPPFPLDTEIELMKGNGVTHLVTKNAGGTRTSDKLVAAAQLGIEVIMIDRPSVPKAREVGTVDEVVAAIQEASL